VDSDGFSDWEVAEKCKKHGFYFTGFGVVGLCLGKGVGVHGIGLYLWICQFFDLVVRGQAKVMNPPPFLMVADMRIIYWQHGDAAHSNTYILSR
jgi:hypothetical protein